MNGLGEIKDRIDMLDAPRSQPWPQGMDYTIGGSIEQELHEQARDDREAKILALRQRGERYRVRGRDAKL